MPISKNPSGSPLDGGRNLWYNQYRRCVASRHALSDMGKDPAYALRATMISEWRRNMKRTALYRLALAAMFTAMGMMLPFLTMQMKEIGNMLLPMHLPVLLCGLVLGWKYGLAVGAILPLMRSLMFGMPVLFPSAVGMAFELAMYGFTVGFLFSHMKRKNLLTLYLSLITAMLAGRAVWGIAMTVLLFVGGNAFPFSAFLAGAFLNAVPGIVLQLVLIPSVMLLLDRARVLRWRDGT